MEHTPEAEALMRLYVPGPDGAIRLKVRTTGWVDGVGNWTECDWVTISFEQFARIQNVLDNLL